MRRSLVILAVLGATLVLVVAAIFITALLWMPNKQQLASDLELELESVLGVKTTVSELDWQLLPMPAIILTDVATEQAVPITIKSLTLYPKLSALYKRSLSFDLAELDGAVVPQLSLRMLERSTTTGGAPGELKLAAVPLERFAFRNVTWITRRGIPVMYDGNVVFDERWRPRTAQLRRPDYQPVTDANLSRVEQQDQWRLNINLGGGTLNGDVQLKTTPSGQLRLDGKFKPQKVEVSTALGAFNRRPVLAGKVSGDTAITASGVSFVDLVQSLQTQTRFVMSPASLLRFDMAKAVKSAGTDHAGQTALDSITGAMNTQNTPQGIVINFKDIKARSGVLSAVGDATLANRRIDAEFAVDLVDGIIGIPLAISGPTDNVRVSVPKGAVAGAVVGTALLPGIGTAVGARVGAAVGKFFGAAPAPAANARRGSPP